MSARIGPRLETITAARIRAVWNYDPLTGTVTVRQKYSSGWWYGETIHTKRREVRVDRQQHQMADLIWLHYYGKWPIGCVDHIDRNRHNNAINNLREATHAQNQWNKTTPNPHGLKGVTWRDRKKNPWLAKIRVNGARINLGSFPTKEEAAEAYKKACLKYHGEFASLEVDTRPLGGEWSKTRYQELVVRDAT